MTETTSVKVSNVTPFDGSQLCVVFGHLNEPTFRDLKDCAMTTLSEIPCMNADVPVGVLGRLKSGNGPGTRTLVQPRSHLDDSGPYVDEVLARVWNYTHS